MAKKRRGPTTVVTATTPAYVPGVPTISSNGSGSITFNFSASGTANTINSDKAQYAVYDNTNGNYLKPDGTSNGASESWNDYSTWNDGEITVPGLTDYTAYTFKAKAKNEADVETAFSANSLTMTTTPGLHYGETSDNLTLEITPSDTRVYGTPTVTGNYATDDEDSYYGAIILSYVLQNNTETLSRVEVQFSENYDPDLETGDWSTANAISSAAGASPNTRAIDVNNGSSKGVITAESGTPFANFAAGMSITITSSENGNEGTYTLESATATVLTTTTVIAGTDNADDESIVITGGNGLITLATDGVGVTHTFVWDSYTDSGGSELDLSVYLRVRAYDTSQSGGDASDYEITDVFGVNNRPAKITWINGDTYPWGDDTTPIIMAVMTYLRGGIGVGFPRIHFFEDSGGSILVLTLDSILSIAGWEYEDAPDSWNTMTVAGIPGSIANGVNRIRITVQAIDALPADTYYINGEMGEVQDT